MGIPGLSRRLEPYATRYTSEELDGFSAIIDGPSLAYYAHKLATVVCASTGRLPSYADVNREAIQWLTLLEQCNMKVSMIFFDGALPQSKRAERLQRHEQNNRRVQQFRASYPSTSCPIPSYLGAVAYAFLAPALNEALADSPFGTRTRTVPGEADDWCALHAKNSPRSIILTSDTDLVLYEYPPETLILFFSDADLAAGIKAFAPHQLRQKLQLKTLVMFAFAIRDGHHDTANDLVANARKVNVDADEYTNFSRRYTMTIPRPKHLFNSDQELNMPNMDVRVSEFVYAALEETSTLLVYLPLLVEDPNQASAWNIGQDIRTLAYSLLATGDPIIHEYKRKAQGIAAQEIHVYSQSQILVQARDLERQIETLKKWAMSKPVEPVLLWPLFALSLVLPELSTAPVISSVLRVLNSEFDNTWSNIQLTARLQSAMYSLRMLKQIIDVCLSLGSKAGPEVRVSLLKIARYMGDFPTITQMFKIPGQSKDVLADHEQLRLLVEEIYTSAGAEVRAEHVSNKKKKQQMREAERKKKKAEQRQLSKP